MKRQTIIGFDWAIRSIVDQTYTMINQTNNPEFILLAIAGGSCSGKSLLAKKMKEAFKKSDHLASVLYFDDYYKNRDHPEFPLDDHNRAIFDLPQSYLLNDFRDDVEILLSGKSIFSPIFDKKSNTRLPGKGRKVEANSIIITEGLFVVKALGNVPNVIKIFIDTDREIRIKRRLKRDTGHLHKTEEDTLRFINERVEPYYMSHIEPQKDQADIIIINND